MALIQLQNSIIPHAPYSLIPLLQVLGKRILKGSTDQKQLIEGGRGCLAVGHSVREVIAKLMVTERGGWEDDAGGRGGAGLTDRADDNVTTGPQVTLLVTHSVSLGREFLCAANITGVIFI